MNGRVAGPFARRVGLGWRILSVRGQDAAFSSSSLRCVLIPFCGRNGRAYDGDGRRVPKPLAPLRPLQPSPLSRGHPPLLLDSACPARSGRCKEIPFFSILYRVPMRADPSYRQRVTTAHPVLNSLQRAFGIPLLSASSASLRSAIYVLSPPMLTNSRAFPKNDVLCFHEITLSRGRGVPPQVRTGRIPDTLDREDS